MVRKTFVVLLLCGFAAVLSAACAGPLGKGEGEACTKVDDCSSDLTCQPILGSKGMSRGQFCCPTPPSASKESNCQPGS
jgi:hypothetical protein